MRTGIIIRGLTAAALLAATSCGSAVRSGSSPMYLVMDNLAGIRGGPTAGQPNAVLFSDVVVQVTQGAQCSQTNPCAFVYGDSGQATMSLAKKDVTSLAAPSSNNDVTISRVHVHYRRPDGGGVAGVDVPADFDTFTTTTIPASGTGTISFELVRVQAKEAQPLLKLVNYPLGTGASPFGAVADVTFYGQDRVGNNVSVMGSIQIEFGDWGDN